MKNKEMIEKLKNNEKLFRYNTPEEQEFFRKIGIMNCAIMYGVAYLVNKKHLEEFSPYKCYCIHPNYKPEPPEPEFEDVEICQIAPNVLGIIVRKGADCAQYALYEIPAMPNFEKFHDQADITIPLCTVANKIRCGFKVYARLRK